MPTEASRAAGVTRLVNGRAVSGTQASDPSLVSVPLLPGALQDWVVTLRESPWSPLQSIFF